MTNNEPTGTNEPEIYDPKWDADEYAMKPHVHTKSGRCLKNRYGPRCTLPVGVDTPYYDETGYVDRVPQTEPKPKQYLVNRVYSDASESHLNYQLADLLNKKAEENYHPIKIDRIAVDSYIVIFYHMPAGPSFTPPF